MAKVSQLTDQGKKAASRRVVPASTVVSALIDPPGPYSRLKEWLEYRAELDTLNAQGLKPFKRKVDAEIARLRREQDAPPK